MEGEDGEAEVSRHAAGEACGIEKEDSAPEPHERRAERLLTSQHVAAYIVHVGGNNEAPARKREGTAPDERVARARKTGART